MYMYYSCINCKYPNPTWKNNKQLTGGYVTCSKIQINPYIAINTSVVELDKERYSYIWNGL